MAILLNESNTIFDGDDCDVLHEGIVDAVKKFYTGKSESEIQEFKRRITTSTTQFKMNEVLSDIHSSLESARSFQNSSLFKRFLAHGTLAVAAGMAPISVAVGVSAAVLTAWFKSGKAESKLGAHVEVLKDLQIMARNKKKKLPKGY